MILRSWKGVIRTADRDAYAAYLDKTGLAEYRQTPGNIDAYTLFRDLPEDRTEVQMLSVWQSLEHVRAFAGDEIEHAVFYPLDDRFLLERDLTVTHSEVVHAGSAPARGDVPRIDDMVFDCADAPSLARFWSELLDRPARRLAGDWFTLDGPAPRLSFQEVADYQPPPWPHQSMPQQAHLDLMVDDLDAAHDRAVALGAIAAGEFYDEHDDPWRVYSDPAGHPFCLVTVRARRPRGSAAPEGFAGA